MDDLQFFVSHLLISYMLRGPSANPLTIGWDTVNYMTKKSLPDLFFQWFIAIVMRTWILEVTSPTSISPFPRIFLQFALYVCLSCTADCYFFPIIFSVQSYGFSLFQILILHPTQYNIPCSHPAPIHKFYHASFWIEEIGKKWCWFVLCWHWLEEG